MSKHVVLAGGSGFLGGHLTLRLKANGYDVKLLSRQSGHEYFWDGRTEGPWMRALEGAEAVINLSGAPIATRWVAGYRKEIAASRVESTQAIGRAIRQCEIPPKVWVNASAVGYYGDAGDRVLDESAPQGTDFLAKVCGLWEKSVFDVQTSHTRKHVIRIGFVLGADGGALPTLAKMTKFFLGGRVGKGRQWVPWVHVADLTRMFEWVIQTDDAPAILNASAPTPVTNAHLMQSIRQVLHRPWAPPAPGFALVAANAITRFPTELALAGQRAIPKAALAAGFTFEHTQFEATLADLLRS